MLGSKLPELLSARPNSTMSYVRRRATVCGLVGWMCGAGLALCAQTSSRLPPNPPTSISNPNSLPAPIAAAAPRADTTPRHRARVTYANGLLQVRADNSSLNQILREISLQTGMKIIGGVTDQRIYGSYGPAPAATVIQTLLDGTGTNILLQETPTHVPLQLVLSPQTGGAAPPPPSSPSYDATENEPELPLPGAAQPAAQARTAVRSQSAAPAIGAPAGSAAPATAAPASVSSTPPSMPQPANNVLGSPNNVSPTPSTLPVTNSVPVSSLPTPSTAPPVSGIVDAPNPPPAGSTTADFLNQTPPDNNPNTAQPATATTNQSSPNGVKTPQQIYEELKQMQQQQQNKANPQGSSAPQ
jgi:hypothetical protein